MALERRTNEREAAVAELEASVTINAARQVQASCCSPICLSASGINLKHTLCQPLPPHDAQQSCQVKSKQFKSNQIKLDHLTSKQIKSNQIRSNRIESNQIKSTQIKSKQIKSNESKSNQTAHHVRVHTCMYTTVAAVACTIVMMVMVAKYACYSCTQPATSVLPAFQQKEEMLCS